MCCVWVPVSPAKSISRFKRMRKVTVGDLFPLPRFSYLFLTFCPFATSFFTFREQPVFCEDKLCYLLLSSEERNGLVGETSRTMRRTGAEYSQPGKSISGKLLSAEIRGCRGSRDWFLVCSLCFCSVRACGEERRGLGIAVQMVCCFQGGKWQMGFYYIFQMWYLCIFFLFV